MGSDDFGNPTTAIYKWNFVYKKRNQCSNSFRKWTANVSSRDDLGHGTHVAPSVQGRNGVAPEAELIVVKLGDISKQGFPRTTQLMTALQYVNRYSDKGKQTSGSEYQLWA